MLLPKNGRRMKVKRVVKSIHPSLIRAPEFIRTLLILSYVIMGFGVLYSSYLGQTYSETISFFVKDGWCDNKIQGIGIHCFGDFYQPAKSASLDSPWKAENATSYSPLNLFYFKILNSQLIYSINSHASLIINIAVTLVSLSIPGIMFWSSKRKDLQALGPWITGLSLVSGPALMLTDRGSSSFLLFPLLFLFFRAIYNESRLQAILFLGLMVTWKPQTLIFAVLVLIVFGLWTFFKSISISIVFFAISFLLYPRNYFSNISNWFLNVQNSQSYLPIPTPGNYSLVNSIGFATGLVRWFNGDSTSLAGAFRPALSVFLVNRITLVIAAIFLMLLVKNKRKISKNEAVLVSTVLFIILPTVTFGYYLVLLFVPLFAILKYSEQKTLQDKLGVEWNFLLIVWVLIVPAWPVSWKNTGINVGPAWEIFGIQWILAQACMSILALGICFRLVSKLLKDYFQS
jgi:hypothetical protein